MKKTITFLLLSLVLFLNAQLEQINLPNINSNIYILRQEGNIFYIAASDSSTFKFFRVNINDKSYGIVHANIPNEFKFWYDLKNELDNYKEEFDNSKLLENILYARTKAKLAMNMLSDENQFIFPDINEIYFGHTVVKFPIKRGNFNFIDTGCVFKGGNLTIKEIGRDYNG